MAECGHCRDCKWSNTQEAVSYHEEALTAPYRNPERLYCTRMTGSGGQAEDPETLAFAVDSEQYGASVEVMPDFGC